MPDISFLSTSINILTTVLQPTIAARAQAYAAYALQSIKQHIEQQGVGAKYSTAAEYVSQQAFINRSAFKPVGKKGEAKKGSKPKASMFIKGGYKQLKSLQGLKSDTVNLVYTYDMLNDIDVLHVQQQGAFTAHATIGAKAAEQVTKLAANRKRYGNFLHPQHTIMQPHNERLVADIAKDVKAALGAR